MKGVHSMMTAIEVKDIDVAYTDRLIIQDINVSIPKEKITTIIGPNGCGKSTLIKTIARILKAKNGAIYLEGQDMHQLDTRQIAKRMAILPQTAVAPGGLTVVELVSYGRFPHRNRLQTLSKKDLDYIRWVIDLTGLSELAEEEIDTLSGGQRQRVWIAMALAQETEILVLDEPTTYLDMAHQLDILLLLKELNQTQKKTIVMVLHDLNQASRFSDFLIGMHQGSIIETGTPKEVMQCRTLRNIFNIDANMTTCPFSSNPICLSYQLCQHKHLSNVQ